MPAAAAAGASFTPLVGGGWWFGVLAVSATLPVLLSLAQFRPQWTAAVASAGGWLAVAIGLLLAGRPSDPGSVLSVVASSVAELVAHDPAKPAPPTLLLAPSLLVWVAAATGAELAGRGPAGLRALTPAWCVWATAVLLGRPGAHIHLATAGALLVLNLVAARPSWWAGRAGQPRAVAGGVAASAILLAGGLAAGALLSALADPQPLRPAAVATVQDDVLTRYERWRSTPARELFTVIGVGPGWAPGGTGPRWRLADLDTLEGSRWTTTAAFTPVRPRAAAPTATVAVTGLDGAFVPAGQVTSAGVGLWADPGTAQLVRRSWTDRVSYDLGPAALYRPGDEVRAEHTALPEDCEPATRRLAAAVLGPDPAPTDRRGAADAAARLAALLALAPPVGGPEPYGCATLDGIERGHRASETQRAAAYVLCLRSRGVPARIVVGFGAGRAYGEHTTITGADALVWPEVHLPGTGWTPMPIPAAGQPAPPLPSDPAAERTPSPDPPAPAGPIDRLRRLSLWLAALVVATAVIPLVALLVRRVRRRVADRRARTGDAATRLQAAWLDVLAHLARSVPIAAGVGGEQVIAASEKRLGTGATADLRSMAADVDRLLYRDETPDDRTASRAWDRRDRVVRDLSARQRAHRRGKDIP